MRLWNAPPADPGLFEQNLIIARNGIWISQYLPFWPAIIALFELARLPPWLAAPVCGAVLLLLLWAALRLECRSTALTVALLLAYGSSDFFLLNSATYFSHCASALTVTGTILCMLNAQRSGRWGWPVAGGVCVGLALLCRIDSTALAGLAALAAWIEQGCSPTHAAAWVRRCRPIGCRCGHLQLAGDREPLVPPTAWAGQIQFGAGGLQGVEARPQQFRMLVQTFWRLGELADTASLVKPALYLVALALRARGRDFRFYDLVPIANFVIFLIYPISAASRWDRATGSTASSSCILLSGAFTPSSSGVAALRRRLLPAAGPGQPCAAAGASRLRGEGHARTVIGVPPGRYAAAGPPFRDLMNDFPSTWNKRANRAAPNLGKDSCATASAWTGRCCSARRRDGSAGARLPPYPAASVYVSHLDHARPEAWLEPLACAGNAH